MLDPTKIKIEKTVYKSGKVCYIGTYLTITKQLILNLRSYEDEYDYDQFAIKELTLQITKEVETKRR